MKLPLHVLPAVLLLAGAPDAPASCVFINEIHYDNSGADTGEFIEVAGPAGTDLTGWTLVLYNGNGGASYDTVALSGILSDQQGGYGAIEFLRAGIQNGAPDGMALVDAGDSVIQFLSYEGSFTAVGGPADGLTSVDIGVSEPSDTPVGHSLQLTGIGTCYGDFTWASPMAETAGKANTGQRFGASVPDGGATAAMLALGLLGLRGCGRFARG